jgi:hypothetical protein
MRQDFSCPRSNTTRILILLSKPPYLRRSSVSSLLPDKMGHFIRPTPWKVIIINDIQFDGRLSSTRSSYNDKFSEPIIANLEIDVSFLPNQRFHVFSEFAPILVLAAD